MMQGALALAALAAVACGGHPAAPSGGAPAAPLPTALAVAERSNQSSRTELAGTVAAERTTAVSSRVMAMVTAVEVQLGDSVRAGQVLVRIDPAVAQGQVAQARGALAQAQAALALAERNHERFQNLAASHAASALELDLATMQYAQAKGAVEQAGGAVAAATSVARESQVTAPFAGRVAQRLVEVGDLAAPGRPLVMLESAAGRRLVLSVGEGLAQAAHLAVGQTLPVRIDAQAGLGEIAGRIVEVSPGPDPLSHAFTVKVDLGAATVPAGAAGRAFLPAGERTAVLVPAAALIEAGGLTLIVVRDAAGRAESRVVAVGERLADGRVEVLSGLAGGESVAVGLAAAPPAGTPLVEGRS
jgi:RND family efflux transporter MFP subunit